MTMDGIPDDVSAAMAAARLRALRIAVLELHKAALDAERERYEQRHGPVAGPQQMLRLVMDDPFFAWLRPLSDFVIQADIRLSDRKPLSPAVVDRFGADLRSIVQSASETDRFAVEYRRTLQHVPEVVVLHGKLMALLN
jgi:hypothetical protein